MRRFVTLAWILCCLLLAQPVYAKDKLMIAAAADLRDALTEIVQLYQQQQPQPQIELIFGASGKLSHQLQHGAPFDLLFSADISYVTELYAKGLTTAPPIRHAIGRLVLWSNTVDASQLTLADLTKPKYQRIAIAQPLHAPYGLRAKQLLLNAGLWQSLQAKLVYGENVAQTAQMVQSGAADIGIVALSLVLSPQLQPSRYLLLDNQLHQPLEQAYIISKNSPLRAQAELFSAFVQQQAAQQIMSRYGFALPEPTRVLP